MEDAEYEIMYRVEDTHWWYQTLHKLFIDRLTNHVPGWQEKDVLDAGCGTGALLERLGRSSHHVGVDLSEQAIAFCQKRNLPRVIQCDIGYLPFADATFDAVICSSVLYHRWVPDVQATLQELRRVLKPDGLLLVNVPAFESLHSEHDEKVFTHRRFRRQQLVDVLSAVGFKCVECSYWTSLLFPFVWVARRYSVVKHGRDFEQQSNSTARVAGCLLRGIMSLEAAAMKVIRFPVGVSIVAVARKL